LLPALFAQAGCDAVGVDNDTSLFAPHVCPVSAAADAYILPFPLQPFDLVTDTNVIFLLGDSLAALKECRRVMKDNGRFCMLIPSEHLSVETAARIADERGLDGTGRESLLGWAQRAEKHVRWTEEQTRTLLSRARLKMVETTVRVGPGFARLSRAVKS
jgi:ubiquinone/menaquinone biosynthesis C-methylase UbiE